MGSFVLAGDHIKPEIHASGKIPTGTKITFKEINLTRDKPDPLPALEVRAANLRLGKRLMTAIRSRLELPVAAYREDCPDCEGAGQSEWGDDCKTCEGTGKQ